VGVHGWLLHTGTTGLQSHGLVAFEAEMSILGVVKVWRRTGTRAKDIEAALTLNQVALLLHTATVGAWRATLKLP
jgi:hypothetical protein